MIESLRDEEETDLSYFRAKVDLVRSLFDKQLAFNGILLEVSCHLGRHATLCHDELPLNVNRNLRKVVYTKLEKYSAEIDDVCSRLT